MSLVVENTDPLLGAFAGSYRLVALVGVGGMGRVYRAEHPELGRQAAVKVLAQALTGDADLVRRFKVEAQAVARLSHPNIVEVLDFGMLTDGRPFYTMELLRGESLHGFLRRNGRTTVATLVSILDPVLAGLDAAHAAGIVHRDLKPENIFLCARDGGYVPKLLDFGVAKLVEPGGASGSGGAGSTPHTQTGSLLGTPMYMSPEQAAGQTTRIGPPSDLYTMGVIAFEMLTGRPPFVAAHLGELIHQHLSATPPLLRTLRPDAPADLEALLSMALAKDPADRPQSAAAMRRALAQIAAPQPVTIVEFGTPGAPGGAGLATPPTRIAHGSEPQRAGGALAGSPAPAGGLGSPAQQASTLRTRRVLFPALAVTAALLAGAAIATVLVRGAGPPALTGQASAALVADAAAPTVIQLAVGAADAGLAAAPDAAPAVVAAAAQRAPTPASAPSGPTKAGAGRAGRSPATPPAHERDAQSGTPGGQRPASNLPPGADGERFERLLKESKQHAANGDHDAQLASAVEALRIAPDDDEANFMAGHAGCMKKDTALAKQHYERIRDRRVRAALDDVCTRFGPVYLTADSQGSPADKSRRAMELYPQAVDALIKDPAKALAIALEIIVLQPTHEGAWLMAAGASCRLGKLDDVKKYLKKVPERMYDVVRLSCEAVKQPFPDPRADAGP